MNPGRGFTAAADACCSLAGGVRALGAVSTREMKAGNRTKPRDGKQTLHRNQQRKSAEKSQRANSHRGGQDRELGEPLLSEHDSSSRPVSPGLPSPDGQEDTRVLLADVERNHDENDDAYWIQPPKDEEGGIVTVDVSLHIGMLHSISTVDNCAYVEFSAHLFWTDRRLIDWKNPDHLPPNLWGPDLELVGTLGEVTEVGGEFCLRDSKRGRLKRVRSFKAMVAKYWNNLGEDFPFDLDTIDVVAYTNSHYVAYNEEKAGVHPTERTYELRQVEKGKGEGSWINLWWNGEVAEWKIHGISTAIDEETAQLDGTKTTKLRISFHVSAKPRSMLFLAI